ncbi:MAG: ABC transporter ATP-binding protein [Bacteroidota bacterium]
MIVAERLSKRFGNFTAVKEVSFEVARGKRLVLLGTSGSGKTTTLKMLNRLIEPSSGIIRINGKDILAQSAVELRRNIGYVIQRIGLFPHYTVAENISVVPRLLHWEKEKTTAEMAALLEKLRLAPDEVLTKYPHQLSGGQRQRVGLARALITSPEIILMDEPFGALDPITRESIRKELLELDVLRDKTLVMVTHDLEEAFEWGHQIMVMDHGECIQKGTPAELLFQPANEFISSFMGHHRFQLELVVVTLTDLLGFLPTSQEDKIENDLSPSDNIRDVLRRFYQGKNILTARKGNIVYSFTKLQLWKAFQEFTGTLQEVPS